MDKFTLYKKINLLHGQLKNLGDRKIAFVLEGRDASGKGGFVKFLMKYVFSLVGSWAH